MGRMRPALFCLFLSSLGLGAAELGQVRSVYLLSMGRGFDQYLANRLTTEHVFQVVADPKRADAVLTDHLGEAFEERMKELYPPPEDTSAEETAQQEGKETPKAPANASDTRDGNVPEQAGDANDSGDDTTVRSAGDAPPKFSEKRLRPSFARARGTVFLVDAQSRQVLWSSYALARKTSPADLDRLATKVVEGLKKDLGK
jgi:hypothetical protein